MAIEIWKMDQPKLCRSPSHTLSIDETQCFACKNHSVVALFVVIAVVLVVDLGNVDTCVHYSLKTTHWVNQQGTLYSSVLQVS